MAYKGWVRDHETFYFLLVESNMRPNQTDLTEIFQLSRPSYWFFSVYYSYRSASSGFSRDAFHAGYSPPIRPVNTPKKYPLKIKLIKVVNPARNEPEIKNIIILTLFCRIARVVGLSSKISVFLSELKISKLGMFELKK
ncbi:MAG: hypothetical protein K8R25_14180 [Methanosarcinales archaeon]|nr:hypothetical protein [Methanosarcinales archaeon]